MDLALVKLNTSEEAVRIFVKTRYENKTRFLGPDFSKPFFDPVSTFIPGIRNIKFHWLVSTRILKLVDVKEGILQEPYAVLRPLS